MNQGVSKDPLAIEEALPETFHEWKRRAETNPAWRDYSLILHAFAEALRRAPLTLEACAEIDPTTCLNLELACLSDVLLFLFPNGTLSAKSYQALTQKDSRQSEFRSL